MTVLFVVGRKSRRERSWPGPFPHMGMKQPVKKKYQLGFFLKRPNSFRQGFQEHLALSVPGKKWCWDRVAKLGKANKLLKRHFFPCSQLHCENLKMVCITKNIKIAVNLLGWTCDCSNGGKNGKIAPCWDVC